MIYLGDNFPKEYRNCLFTCNIHGNRVNRDRIDDTAKGPVLRHEKDFLMANDEWFRGIAINYGPDGGVYVSDWCDTGECHNYQVVDKTNGRIYKVVYGRAEAEGDRSGRCRRGFAGPTRGAGTTNGTPGMFADCCRNVPPPAR